MKILLKLLLIAERVGKSIISPAYLNTANTPYHISIKENQIIVNTRSPEFIEQFEKSKKELLTKK